MPRLEIVDAKQIEQVIEPYLPPSAAIGVAASEYVRAVPAPWVPIFVRLEGLELLGAIPVGTTLRELLYGGSLEPAGLFDDRTGIVYVRSPRGVPERSVEDALAHELTHALEHQHAIEPLAGASFLDPDRLEARRALVEGPAVEVQYLYARRYLRLRLSLSQFLAALRAQSERQFGLPPFLLADLLFPYVQGAEYVNGLLAGQPSWALVNTAERHPPSDTQQVVAPRARPATAQRAFEVADVLGPRWQLVGRIGFGAFDTATLLAPGMVDPSPRLMGLWRSGTIEIWTELRPGDSITCRRPCSARSLLVGAWTWANASVAAQAARQLRAYVGRVLDALGPSGGASRTRLGSGGAVAHSGTASALVLSPSPSLSYELAGGVARQIG